MIKAKRIKYARQILEREMLPHMGTSFTAKAYFLGYMVNRLLSTVLGRENQMIEITWRIKGLNPLKTKRKTSLSVVRSLFDLKHSPHFIILPLVYNFSVSFFSLCLLPLPFCFFSFFLIVWVRVLPSDSFLFFSFYLFPVPILPFPLLRPSPEWICRVLFSATSFVSSFTKWSKSAKVRYGAKRALILM